jgi:hypothetical protein
MYCDPQDLRLEIRAAQADGRPSDALIGMAYKIAEGVRVKYARWLDPDDFGQECLVQFLRKLPEIDPDRGNPFNYVTLIFRFRLGELNRVERRQEILAARLKAGAPPETGPLTCRWRGQTQTLHHVARVLGVPYGTLCHRLLMYGPDVERAMTGIDTRPCSPSTVTTSSKPPSPTPSPA